MMNTKQDNPYKGLNSYEEKDKDKFYGRGEETEHVLQLVEFNFLSVIFGKSGIGKTSLLNAGVFPRLREENFLPIRLRLNYSEGEPPLLEQIHQIISDELKERGVKIEPQEKDKPAPSLKTAETLWEYFHRVNHFKGSQMVTPVLVFDQFEELFTLGKNHKDKNALINELYWLIENQYPTPLKERILRNENIENEFSFSNTRLNVKMIIGLKENYLPHMNGLKARIPSIDRTLFRLIHLNGKQAREIIIKPGVFSEEKLVDDILRRFYPEVSGGVEPIKDEDLEVEPMFLSLLCHQLYEKPKQELKSMTDEEQDKILEDFYNLTMEEFSVEVRNFIESKLLTEGGFRTPLYLDPDLPFRNDIEKLVDYRILRKTYEGKREYIEIIHDVLARIMKEIRKKRKEEEKRKAELKKRKLKMQAIIIGSIILSILSLMFFGLWRNADKQYRNAEVSRLTAEALLEFPQDNTRAIRIAEAAYKKAEPNIPARTSKALSDIAYTSFEKPFYIANLRHNGPVYSAVFSPDGRHIMTASEDGTAKVCDTKGKVSVEVKHDARIMSAVFSPDGSRILTASWDKSVKLWDMKGTLLLDLKHDGIVSTAAFFPDGQRILTASRDGKISIWNLEGKELAVSPYNKVVSSVAFSPDGKRLLTVSWDKTAKLWDIRNEGKPSILLDLKHNSTISSAVFSPDGRYILSALEQGTVYFWNLQGKVLLELDVKEQVSSAVFSPDGQRILTISRNGAVKLWSMEGKLLSEFKYNAPLNSAVFSPDGRLLVIASEDGTAKVWDLQNNIVKNLDEQKADMKIAIYSPDGSRIFTSSIDGTSKLWTSDGIFLYQLNNSRMLSSAVFSLDGRKILTASQSTIARLWSIEGKSRDAIIISGDPDTPISTAVFSPDGKQIITTSQGFKVQLWNHEGKYLRDVIKSDVQISSAVFSPDGKWILTISLDNSAKLWTLEGRLVKQFNHNGAVSTAVFSPDSKKILTASTDGTVLMWNPDGEKFLELRHKGEVSSAVFSAYGRKILTASKDGTSKLWDLQGNLLADLDKHTDTVNSAVFSPDGRRMLSASRDGTVKIWLTPEAIFDWLKTANISSLSDDEKRRLGI